MARLEPRKVVQIEELKGKDLVEVLKALSLGSAGQVETLKKIVDVLEKPVEIGHRAIVRRNAACGSTQATAQTAALLPAKYPEAARIG